MSADQASLPPPTVPPSRNARGGPRAASVLAVALALLVLWELTAWAFDDFLREKILALNLFSNIESRIVISAVKSTTAVPLDLAPRNG